MDICSFLKIVGIEHDEVLKAIQSANFKDFEDCLQDRCAKSIGASYIITRNVADFSGSEVLAILPEDFLKIIASEKECKKNDKYSNI